MTREERIRSFGFKVAHVWTDESGFTVDAEGKAPGRRWYTREGLNDWAKRHGYGLVWEDQGAYPQKGGAA